MNNITARIRVARKNAGISQTDLASAVKVSLRSVQRYESDDDATSKISLKTADLISEQCGVSLQWLLLGTGNMERTDDGIDIDKKVSELINQFQDKGSLESIMKKLLFLESHDVAVDKVDAFLDGLISGITLSGK